MQRVVEDFNRHRLFARRHRQEERCARAAAHVAVRVDDRDRVITDEDAAVCVLPRLLEAHDARTLDERVLLLHVAGLQDLQIGKRHRFGVVRFLVGVEQTQAYALVDIVIWLAVFLLIASGARAAAACGDAHGVLPLQLHDDGAITRSIGANDAVLVVLANFVADVAKRVELLRRRGAGELR